jgi:KGK domain
MDNEFGLLGDDEVLFIRSGRILMSNPTFKVSEFLDSLAQLVSEQEGEWSDEREGWFNDQGQSCEVLRYGNQGWQRGRVRIRLEFCPENPPKLLRESPSTERSYRDDLPQDDLYTPRRNRDTSPRGDSYQWRGSNDDMYPDPDEDY